MKKGKKITESILTFDPKGQTSEFYVPQTLDVNSVSQQRFAEIDKLFDVERLKAQKA